MAYFAVWTPEGDTQQTLSCFETKSDLYFWLIERSEARGHPDFSKLKEDWGKNEMRLSEYPASIFIIKGTQVEPTAKRVEVKEWWVE